ncbi:winged helix-turn-helix domain-containing protein [Clostridium sp.]|uniref:winged helix-turn-helix domain-containing protein n=1 Tax=Clostridium sp. TaxID=1506 RepID=UPI00307C8223
MFSRILTQPSAVICSGQIDRLRRALDEADTVLIGAGAGLSASAGFVYDGERFERYFSDFQKKYGIRDMYSGGFYPYASQEESWAYWSRYVWVNRYMDPPKPVYDELLALVKDKDYFVLTTNVDHCFQKAGFDKKRLFYTQGDYGLFQCSEPCCQETWENESTIKDMMEWQENMRVSTELLPRCPRCGKPLTMNLRSDNKFVQDEGWYRAAERYEDFIRRHQKGKIIYLELGVGFNTPVIIKYPFWRMTAQNPKAVYACINMGQAVVPKEIQKRAICMNDDIGNVITDGKSGFNVRVETQMLSKRVSNWDAFSCRRGRSMSNKILIIDLPSCLKRYWENSPWYARIELYSCTTLTEAQRVLTDGDYSLILLNVSGLSEECALAGVERMRLTTPAPLLVLAPAGTSGRFLKAGADMCVPEGLEPDMIISHALALLRRYTLYDHFDKGHPNQRAIQRGDIFIDPRRHTVLVREQPVNLRLREFSLLHYFMRNPQLVLTPEQICTGAWNLEGGYGGDVSGPIAILRRAIEPNPQSPIYIKTVNQVGYRFTAYFSGTCGG